MTTQQWRAYMLEHHGGWRNWALRTVASNWRVRLRLPRLTAKARACGLIVDEPNQ